MARTLHSDRDPAQLPVELRFRGSKKSWKMKFVALFVVAVVSVQVSASNLQILPLLRVKCECTTHATRLSLGVCVNLHTRIYHFIVRIFMSMGTEHDKAILPG